MYRYKYVPEGDGVRCDFCSNAYIKFEYPTGDFDMPVISKVPVRSEGGWLACEKCHDLIEDKKWELLAQHAISTYIEHGPVRPSPKVRSQMEKDLLPKVRELHDNFQKQRQGEARMVTSA